MAPGGFIELTDLILPAGCDDDTMMDQSAVYQWTKLAKEAGGELGRPFNSTDMIIDQLFQAGFTNIVHREFKWPLNHWPRDKKYKELGMRLL